MRRDCNAELSPRLASAVEARLTIVSLNVWGGQAYGPLLDYLRAYAPTTDLFCLQEVLDAPVLLPQDCGFRTTLYGDLVDALPGFAGDFVPIVGWDESGADGAPVRVNFGLATFARRTLPLASRRAAWIIEHEDTLDAVPGLHRITRWLQTTAVVTPAGVLLVGNYHGIARPGTKLDTDERLEQSRSIRRVVDVHDGPVVLTGDFNLLPDTESIWLLQDGLSNLVMERAIPTTRSRLNPYFGTPQEQVHADYTFVSTCLRVADFAVPDVGVSDHLPLHLTLDVAPSSG